MMEYFYSGMQILSCVLDIVFLYIWLNAFSEQRKLNRGIITTVILCSAVVMYYINSMGNIVFCTILGLAVFLLFSVLLFNDRIKSLFFYTIINYVLGIAVGILFELISEICLTAAGVGDSLGLLLILPEKGLLFVLYYFIVKVSIISQDSKKISSAETSLSEDKEQYDWKQYLLFYSTPIVTYCSIIGIYASGFAAVHSIWGKGQIVIGSIGAIITNSAAVYLFGKFAEMMEASEKLELANMRCRMEEKYYHDMDNLHEQYDIFLHDTKHMLRTIAALSKEDNCVEIDRLIGEMRISLGNIEQKSICSNKILNALIVERKSYAEDNGINLDLEIKEPLFFQEIEDVDLITLMGNLLDNAIEAEKQAGKREGILCHMRMAREGRHMIIQVENSYVEKKSGEKIELRRQKSIGAKHGIGLKSVQNIVRKYGGIIESKKNEGRYNVKIILPVQSSWEGYPSTSVQKVTLMN